jgi:hypothetical protein
MRVYFIKDYFDGYQLHRKGTDSILWDARKALDGYAVPYEQKDESQAEEKTGAQSKAKSIKAKSAAGKIKETETNK